MSAPLLLCIDTALPVAVLGLAEGTEPRAELLLESKRDHAERLLDGVQQVLDQGGAALDQLDAIAVGIGPGSFVGVRIAVATAKGLAVGRGLPLIALSAPACLALSTGDHGAVAVAIDAKKGQVYAAAYRVEGDQLSDPPLLAPAALDPDLACQRMQSLGPLASRVGEGFDRYADDFAALAASPRRDTPVRIAAMAQLANRAFVDRRFADPATLAPAYARRSEAELKRDLAAAARSS